VKENEFSSVLRGLLSLAETRKPDEKKWKQRHEDYIGSRRHDEVLEKPCE